MDIVHHFNIAAPVAKVYKAFTTEKGINGWWSMDCNIATQVGGISQVRFNRENQVEMHFRVDELVPDQKALWACVKNPNPAWPETKLSFEIKAQGDSTDFTFMHGGWEAQWEGQLPYEQTKQGWQHFMNSLKKYCEEGVGEPW